VLDWGIAVEKELLSPDKALEIIMTSISPLGTECITLAKAYGRTLSEDVFSDIDLPPFDNSAMDGYAIIAENTLGASPNSPKVFEVIAEQPAGTVVNQSISSQTAIRIMTGAPIPKGADAVVIVEHTVRENNRMSVFVETQKGANIRFRGEDIKHFQRVLLAGTRIGPAEMGLLAAIGKQDISVYRIPRVAVITSGDELVDIKDYPEPGKIRDSNQYSTLGQVLEAGGQISMLVRSPDEKEELAGILSQAADISDVLITIGGVSVGDHDFVKETLERLGEIKFWKVAIKPGKPLAYGSINGKPLFGLPGNPASSMVTFDIFVRPALMLLSGCTHTGQLTVSGKVSQDIKHKKGRREFVRANTVWEADGFFATPTGDQGSGMLSSMLGANSYIVVDESNKDVAAGQMVNIILLDRNSASTSVFLGNGER